MRDTVKMTVELEGHVFWKLSKAAEAQGTTLAVQLARIAAQIASGARPAPKPAEVPKASTGYRETPARAAVRELHAAGLTDKQIAVRLNILTGTVHYHRKNLGLEPNRRRAS